MRLFNALYYRRHPPDVRRGIVSWENFFYPLDGLLHWNRIYGARGFTQYQCVLPSGCGDGGMRGLLDLFVREGGTCFLAVIKDCGPEGRGMLSFPLEGMSLALDFPVAGDRTQRLVDRLNEYVISHGGRIYLAKDAFTRPEHYRVMDSRLSAFLDVRRRWDPRGRLRSALSVRLFGDQR
jgi:FAD/FMN-containing dehydrogenase